MTVKEIRAILPFSLTEYAVGHLYGAHRFRHRSASKTATTLVDSALGVADGTKVVYTHKKFVVTKFLPAWAQKILQTENLAIEAACWDEFPRIRTVYAVPLAASKLSLSMETLFVDGDRGSLQNALNLSESELKARQVEYCDIADDKATDMLDPAPEDDPKFFTSKKRERGPLRAGWQERASPVLCAYTVIRCNVQMWGVKHMAEDFIVRNLQEVVMKLYRLTFCWMDDWIDMPLEDALALELGGSRADVRLVPPTPSLSGPARSSSIGAQQNAASGAVPSGRSSALSAAPRQSVGNRLREKLRSRL